MHEIAFQNKATFPVSKDATHLRLGTCFWKYLNRSSRPDTGRRKGFGPLSPPLSEVGIESQPPIPFGRRKAHAISMQCFRSPFP